MDTAALDADHEDSGEPGGDAEPTVTDGSSETNDATGASETEPDAGQPDASAPDAAILTTVRLRRGGAPAPGVEVLFQGSDGHTLSSTVTGPSGTVQYDVPAGGMVTFFDSAPGGDISSFLKTVVGIEPGDVIDAELTDPRVVSQMLVSPPEPYPNAHEYGVEFSCGDAAYRSTFGPIAVSRTMACYGAVPNPRALLMALDSNRQILAISTLAAVSWTLTATTEVTMPAWTESFGEIAVHVRQLPTSVAEISAVYEPISRGFAFEAAIDRQSASPATSDPTRADLVLRTVPDASNKALVTTKWRTAANPDVIYMMTSSLAPTSTTVTLDTGAAAIPALYFDGVDSAIPARPRATWSITPDFGDAGAMIVLIPGRAPWRNTIWMLAFPPSLRRLRLPELSPSIAAQISPMPPQVIVLFFADFPTLADFASAKQTILDKIDPSRPASFSRAVGYGPF